MERSTLSLWSLMMKMAKLYFAKKLESASLQGWSLGYRERTFYIVFAPAEKYVWSPFLKKNFQHCYVIEKLDTIWLACDPTRLGLNITLPPCTAEHPLIENMMMLDYRIRILEVITKGQVGSFLMKPKILSCVSVVQYVTGISLFLCVTPFSLFKNLLRCKHKNLISVREIER